LSDRLTLSSEVIVVVIPNKKLYFERSTYTAFKSV